MICGATGELSPRLELIDQPDLSTRMCGDFTALDDFVEDLRPQAPCGPGTGQGRAAPRGRINAEPATAERDLGKLVLAIVDLVRQLMERQALRRINAGSLRDDEVERMGETFLKFDRKMVELRAAFGLEKEDLNLSLGPIRDLL